MSADLRYEEEILSFRRRREAKLVGPDGWLALVERIPLVQGDNEVPFGQIYLEGRVVRLGAVQPGTTHGGQPARPGQVLRTDAGGQADVLEWSGRRYDVNERGDTLSIRVRDPAEAARRGVRIPYYPVDPRWRLAARYEAFAEPRLIDIPFTSDEVHTRPSPGELLITYEGATHRLEVLLEKNPDRLFVLFGDLTNRDETYGAGRFVYAPMPVGDAAEIDFNRACNPACVFNALVTCPLPPLQNRLPFRIPAGERYPGDGP